VSCPICDKHRGEGQLVGGPEVWGDEEVTVYHAPPGADGTAYLGHLFVETVRHVAHLDELTEAEAQAAAWAARRTAIGLRAELDPEHVFSMIVGRGVAHFHQHVFVRHRGTPDALAWHASNQWQGAPRADRAALDAFADRLRRYFRERR
jgi:diadenosine tetraphosphate (Ap4A) HIT family hydrolase